MNKPETVTLDADLVREILQLSMPNQSTGQWVALVQSVQDQTGFDGSLASVLKLLNHLQQEKEDEAQAQAYWHLLQESTNPWDRLRVAYTKQRLSKN